MAKARAEEMAWYDKVEACEEVTDETCLSRAGRKPISCRWRDINKGDRERVERRSRWVAREVRQKGTDSYFAGAPLLALARCVISRVSTKSKTGKRRQLMVFAKRAFLHGGVLTETHVQRLHLSGGCLRVRRHTLATWSSTQKMVSLSSTVPECYSMVRCPREAIELANTVREQEHEAHARIRTCAAAARGLALRSGSKQRHQTHGNKVLLAATERETQRSSRSRRSVAQSIPLT